jgi:uncharacterized protein YkwD
MSISRRIVSTLVVFAIGAVLATADTRNKPKVKATADEQKLLQLTNQERKKARLPPLKMNLTLVAVARAHSANMARQGKMEHVLDGKAPNRRVTEGGYRWASVAENIATGEGWDLEDVMKDWMSSKIHRDNILARKFTEIGIGIADDGKGNVYFTQVFARPKKR